MSKKLINSPEHCVDEMLDGLVKAHPGLTLHSANRVILRKEWAENKNQVALICGGGSGHEPFAGAGTILFIANYTGDCLNFGLAVEWAKSEGLKIAGAMAEEGKSMSEIIESAKMLLKSLATYGVGLSACSLPGSGPLFKIGEDEMELGLGVHGEAGIKRVKVCTATETVKIMLESITKTLNLKSGDEVAIFINNLGGTSQLEQWVMTGEVHKQFTSMRISILRTYSACIMTSLEMAGIQISVLKMSGSHKKEWLTYLDARTDACGWPGSALSLPTLIKDAPPLAETEEVYKSVGPSLNRDNCNQLKKCLVAAANALISNAQRLNELDSACGILQHLADLPVSYPYNLFKKLSALAEDTMGGTSGALYSLMLARAGLAFETTKKSIDATTWGLALKEAITGTLHYSTAKPGDRTMEFEHRNPSTLNEALTALEAAVEAAKEGCKKTRYMKARLGRASYVDSSYITNVDAGAYGVTVWLEAIYNELKL
ncbi:Triokinase/FMN cyclase [Blattella germanica]|nr:Triokinase/FMN cyclase [Blattella germanica]